MGAVLKKPAGVDETETVAGELGGEGRADLVFELYDRGAAGMCYVELEVGKGGSEAYGQVEGLFLPGWKRCGRACHVDRCH